ncbi:MAG: hypothetical protein H6740_01820 [Alphaproteobacteria bacterium]|nr:hypothetical protein [Alphaproteobacteria bacterium]
MLLLLLACTTKPVEPAVQDPAPEAPAAEESPACAGLAEVSEVQVMDSDLLVTVSSPDTGCGCYADWWEVLDAEGALLYRRVLAHSHVEGQPFTRGGGPVEAAPDQVLWVRAHMAPGGYGGQAFTGTLAGGFAAGALPAGFAAGLESAAPQPDGCAF